jgi:hypothetical protein
MAATSFDSCYKNDGSLEDLCDRLYDDYLLGWPSTSNSGNRSGYWCSFTRPTRKSNSRFLRSLVGKTISDAYSAATRKKLCLKVVCEDDKWLSRDYILIRNSKSREIEKYETKPYTPKSPFTLKVCVTDGKISKVLGFERKEKISVFIL